MWASSTLLVLLTVSVVSAYDCHTCDGDMCCHIPHDGQYFLTDFCAGYPHSETSCGKYCNDYRFFTADRQRFGCNPYLHICGHGKCLKAKVIDAGPAKSVEESAGGAVIDASPDVCRHITGHSSCGWSDHIRITARVAHAAEDDDSRDVGPFYPTVDEYIAIVGRDVYDREVREGVFELANPAKAAICCMSDQYQGFTFSYDEKHHWRAGINVSFDYTNKKLAIEIHERHGGGEVHIMSEIVDFNKKVAYSIDVPSKTCHTSQITHTMQQDCTPADASLEAKPVIGGTLNAYLYSFTVGAGEQQISGAETRAQQNCVPIESVMFSKHWGVDQMSYFDYTTGIKNPSVFTPPSYCNASAVPESKPLAISAYLRLSSDMTQFRLLTPTFIRDIGERHY